MPGIMAPPEMMEAAKFVNSIQDVNNAEEVMGLLSGWQDVGRLDIRFVGMCVFGDMYVESC